MVQVHPFSIWAIDGNEWYILSLSRLNLGKARPHALQVLGQREGREPVRQFRQKSSLLHLLEIEPRFLLFPSCSPVTRLKRISWLI